MGKAEVAHRERGALELLLEDARRGAVDGAPEVVGRLEGVLDSDEVALVSLSLLFVCLFWGVFLREGKSWSEGLFSSLVLRSLARLRFSLSLSFPRI